ncbi:MAG: hypothetical protein ACYSVY_08590 [Planctomycetota bacterium]|jgi:hypothetical protein
MAILSAVVIVCSYAGGILDWRFITITPVACALLYLLFRKGRSVWNLTAGAQLGWVGLMFMSSIVAPGDSYMLTWPLLSAVIAIAIVLLRRKPDSQSVVNVAVLAIFAVPAVLWCSNLAYLYFLAMGLPSISMGMPTVQVAMALVSLLMSLLVPHCHYITSNSRWVVPGAAAGLGLVLIAAAKLDTQFDRDHPRANSIYYTQNVDSGQASWLSNDAEADEWTSHYLSHEPNRLGQATTPRMRKRAPSVDLASPEITVTEDSVSGDVRTVRLHLISRRYAPELEVWLPPNLALVGAQINGTEVEGLDEVDEELAGKAWWRWVYLAPPTEGISLTLRSRSTDPIVISLTDVSCGLPEIPGFRHKPRPEYMMPRPSHGLLSDCTDVTKVTRSLRLGKWPNGETNALRGTIKEKMDAGGYTYVLLVTEQGDVWAAAKEFGVAVGDEVELGDMAAMHDFRSPTLDRIFEEILFAGRAEVIGGRAAAEHTQRGQEP